MIPDSANKSFTKSMEKMEEFDINNNYILTNPLYILAGAIMKYIY